jgi:hypothetical protein
MFEGQGEELPPLNAGAMGDSVYEPFVDLDAAKEESSTTEAKQDPIEAAIPGITSEDTLDSSQDTEGQEAPKAGSDADDYADIRKAMLGEDGDESAAEETAVPEGVSADEWKAFQEFKKAQAQPGEAPSDQPTQETPPIDPVALEITEEEFDKAFEFDGFKGVMNKVSQAAVHAAAQAHAQMRDQMYGEVDEAMQFLDKELTKRMENMIHLHDLTKDIPEIHQAGNYRKAFQIALDKTKKNARDGDLRGPVEEAVKIFKSVMGEAPNILNTKKVDVRPKQQAPRGGTTSGRNVHTAKQESKDDDGISFLGSLL